MKRIEDRRLYKFISATLILNEEFVTKSGFELDKHIALRSKLISIYNEVRSNTGDELKQDDIIVLIKTFDYGDGKNNPLEKVLFFAKHDLNHTFTIKGEQVCILNY
jgi:hypothetical protein